MRLSGIKVFLVVACVLISFLLYAAYVVATVVAAGFVVATVVAAGFAALGTMFAQIGQAIALLSIAVLCLCLLMCFLLMPPIDFAGMLLGFLPLLRALLEQ